MAIARTDSQWCTERNAESTSVADGGRRQDVIRVLFVDRAGGPAGGILKDVVVLKGYQTVAIDFIAGSVAITLPLPSTATHGCGLQMALQHRLTSQAF